MIVSVLRAMKSKRGIRTFATYNGKDLYFPKYGCSLYEYQDDPVIKKKFHTPGFEKDKNAPDNATTTTRIASTNEIRKQAALRELVNDLENRIEYDEEFGSRDPANVKTREEMRKRGPWNSFPSPGRED